MSKYIDAEALWDAFDSKAFDRWRSNGEQGQDHFDEFLIVYEVEEMVKNAPEAVVRCKYCKHYDEWLGEMMCTRDGYYRWAMKPSDFCSYGDRKDG